MVGGLVLRVVQVVGAGFAAGPVFGAVMLLVMLRVPADVVGIGDVGVEAALGESNVRQAAVAVAVRWVAAGKIAEGPESTSAISPQAQLRF